MTIAVIHHHLRGYSEDCLASLAAAAPAGTEFLLVQGHDKGRQPCESSCEPSQGLVVRVVPVSSGDRATAKNRAMAEARGEIVLLATADTLAARDAVELLRRFVAERHGPVVASAQLLFENGLMRPTTRRFPSIVQELNTFACLWRGLRFFRTRRLRSPSSGGPFRAPAVRATFVMARRETFLKVGEFAEGYRFAHEDIEWCHRAREKGVQVYVVPQAHVFTTPPQLHGALSAPVRAAMEESLCRLVEATRGRGYAAAFCAIRRAKSLLKWSLAAPLNRLLCGHSIALAGAAAAHGAIWRMRRSGSGTPGLRGAQRADVPPDIESRVRWEFME